MHFTFLMLNFTDKLLLKGILMSSGNGTNGVASDRYTFEIATRSKA